MGQCSCDGIEVVFRRSDGAEVLVVEGAVYTAAGQMKCTSDVTAAGAGWMPLLYSQVEQSGEMMWVAGAYCVGGRRHKLLQPREAGGVDSVFESRKLGLFGVDPDLGAQVGFDKRGNL